MQNQLKRMLNWLIYAVLGRLLIFLWMKLELPEKIEKIKFISSLHKCDLCSGVWIFIPLAFFMNIDLLYSWFGFGHIFIISELITGCLTSYIVWIFMIGFREVHLNITVI